MSVTLPVVVGSSSSVGSSSGAAGGNGVPSSTGAAHSPHAPTSHPTHPPPPSIVAMARQRRATLLENLLHPVNKEGGRNYLDIALAARRQRVALMMSPNERETDKRSKSGRQLSEIEILQEKHEPEFRQIIPSVADAVTSVMCQHQQLLDIRTKDDRFVAYETNSAPGIGLDDYIHRIAEYTYVSPATLVAALILIDRFCQRHESLLILPLNVYKVFFVAVRVASKVVDLRSLNNKNFAQIGGVSNRHLNDLEARFLIDLRFDLFISPGEFHQYAQRLVPHQPSVPRALAAVARQRGDSQVGNADHAGSPAGSAHNLQYGSGGIAPGQK